MNGYLEREKKKFKLPWMRSNSLVISVTYFFFFVLQNFSIKLKWKYPMTNHNDVNELNYKRDFWAREQKKKKVYKIINLNENITNIPENSYAILRNWDY